MERTDIQGPTVFWAEGESVWVSLVTVTQPPNTQTKHPNQKGQGYVIYSTAYQITLSSSLGGMYMHVPYLVPFDLINGMVGIGLRCHFFGISDTIDYR
jgi:hypothetical protein